MNNTTVAHEFTCAVGGHPYRVEHDTERTCGYLGCAHLTQIDTCPEHGEEGHR